MSLPVTMCGNNGSKPGARHTCSAIHQGALPEPAGVMPFRRNGRSRQFFSSTRFHGAQTNHINDEKCWYNFFRHWKKEHHLEPANNVNKRTGIGCAQSRTNRRWRMRTNVQFEKLINRLISPEKTRFFSRKTILALADEKHLSESFETWEISIDIYYVSVIRVLRRREISVDRTGGFAVRKSAYDCLCYLWSFFANAFELLTSFM